MALSSVKAALAALALFALSACATAPHGPEPYPGPSRPPVPHPTTPPPRPERFADLPGWAQEDHVAAFDAYRATCQAAREPAMAAICRRAMSVDLLDRVHARAFFEDNFRPEAIPGEGVLTAPARVYNIGNHRPENLRHVVALLEQALGRSAATEMLPMQPGDVPETFADVSDLMRDVGFRPDTAIEDGIQRFGAWYRKHYCI